MSSRLSIRTNMPATDGTFAAVDEGFLDLFPRYIANRGRDVETVAAALERGDYPLIRSIGHNMRGSGCSFGLDELSAMGAALESAALAADRVGILRELPRISAYLSRIDIAAVPTVSLFGVGAPVTAATAAVPAQGKSIDVLLVDDQEINVAIIGRFLGREGYSVKSVDSGEAALTALAQPPLPGLVLLDVVMGGADGFETCRRIKSDPVTRGVPVVLVSSAGSERDRVRGWAAGADGFLSKPVCRLELIERVRVLVPLEARAAADQAEPR